MSSPAPKVGDRVRIRRSPYFGMRPGHYGRVIHRSPTSSRGLFEVRAEFVTNALGYQPVLSFTPDELEVVQ